MTPLHREVRRRLEVTITERGRTRPIVVELRREGLALRQAGTLGRLAYLLPWRLAYTYAAGLAAVEVRRARRMRRAGGAR